MKPKLLVIAAVIAVTSAFAVRQSAQASNAATFTLPQSPTPITLVNGLDGFDFTPTVNLTVTALGWYDHNGDGLSHTHPVGIYVTSSQTLAAPSSLVSTASALDSSSNFRFEPVAPFTLSAGITYTLVGYGEGPGFDPYVSNPSGGITFGPGINYVRLRTSRSTGLEFPTIAGEVGVLQNLFWGPNFQYTPVPEPHVLGLLCIGLGIAISARRRVFTK